LRTHGCVSFSTGKTAAGPGAARNIGTENARYTLLFHLDADDRYAEDYLARIVPVLETAGACVGAVRLIDPISGDEIPLFLRPAADCLMTVRKAVRYCLGYATVAINSRMYLLGRQKACTMEKTFFSGCCYWRKFQESHMYPLHGMTTTSGWVRFPGPTSPQLMEFVSDGNE
jgi:glycosyltransferase involved in cell wall biosynthesis